MLLLSGANDCLLAATRGVNVYPGYGATFTHHIAALERATTQDEWDHLATGAGAAAIRWAGRLAETLLTRSPRRRGEANSSAFDGPRRFADRLDLLLDLATDTLGTWRMLGDGLGARVIYVLQPVVPWTPKALAPEERSRYDQERRAIQALDDLVQPETYARVRSHLRGAAAAAGVEFHDANDWFGPVAPDRPLFSGALHLTDAGNAENGVASAARARRIACTPCGGPLFRLL